MASQIPFNVPMSLFFNRFTEEVVLKVLSARGRVVLVYSQVDSPRLFLQAYGMGRVNGYTKFFRMTSRGERSSVSLARSDGELYRVLLAKQDLDALYLVVVEKEVIRRFPDICPEKLLCRALQSGENNPYGGSQAIQYLYAPDIALRVGETVADFPLPKLPKPPRDFTFLQPGETEHKKL